MSAPRMPETGPSHRDRDTFPKGGVPRGYDQSEFAPEQCTRDFGRPRRSHEADEERQHLRMADAAIGDGTEDAGAHVGGKWDSDDDDAPVDGSSRLYKD
ncbi:hypothetical protein ACLBXM_00315 [Xanthobacteraceae bacterium A53D]